VERGARTAVTTFYVPDLPSSPGGVASLGRSSAHHAAVKRLSEGDEVRLTDGAGSVARATIRSLRREHLLAEVGERERVAPLPVLEVLVPVADRDRMLWLAEKCAELAVTVWQPVLFARSRSVAPRGEGEAFATKVRARMIAALEQSGGAWLPDVRRERPLEAALAGARAPAKYVLVRSGGRLNPSDAAGGASVILGPEGGIEEDELAAIEAAGWRRVSLGTTTLRFETAGVAAAAVIRAGTSTVDAGD
jgi:16S rRNA (uracil1498-N3)-methyltransferase